MRAPLPRRQWGILYAEGDLNVRGTARAGLTTALAYLAGAPGRADALLRGCAGLRGAARLRSTVFVHAPFVQCPLSLTQFNVSTLHIQTGRRCFPKAAKNTGLFRNPANFQPLIPAWTRNAVHVRTGFLDDVYQRKIHICTVHAMLEQSQASNCPETAQKRFLFRIPEDNLLSLVSPYTRSCVRIFRIPTILRQENGGVINQPDIF